MISSRVAAAVAAGVLVVGILVGAAGSVLLGSSGNQMDGWGPGYHGMMGGHGYGMMDGGNGYDQMLDEMREHMGWPGADQ